jgi:hypothetical protein
VQADFPSIKYKILSYKSVQALKSKPVVLIQTDKSDYRPKQEVKFRLTIIFLFLDLFFSRSKISWLIENTSENGIDGQRRDGGRIFLSLSVSGNYNAKSGFKLEPMPKL